MMINWADDNDGNGDAVGDEDAWKISCLVFHDH